MIKVSVMYPNTEGARFDHTYYRDKHMPMVKDKLGEACLYYTIRKHQRVRTALHRYYIRTCFCQRRRHAQPQAAPCARHDGYLIVQPEFIEDHNTLP